ncbi:MAG TPA: alpha/beta hydrolase [Acidimicrobiales bacterium]|nr:alpha/beta hydrolase [Acidimicrobiales bacterium]
MNSQTPLPSSRTNPFDRLDPEIAQVVATLAFGPLDTRNLAAIRAFAFEFPESDATVRSDFEVPGDPDLRVRVIRPRAIDGRPPCLFWMHGGGYVFGAHTMDDPMLESLCATLTMVAVSVEYRLAPETPFPGPIDDCYRSLRWVCEHAEALGIDSGCIGVGGSSAGGGLAAALTLVARDRGGPPLAFQLLDQPMLDDRQVTASSRQPGLPVWTRESNEFGWRSYLGRLYGSEDVPYTAAPARADDLSHLPPAFISVGAVDGLVDEDALYALRLNAWGVPCELHVYPGACHGYHIAPSSRVAIRSRRDVEEWLAHRLGERVWTSEEQQPIFTHPYARSSA